MGAVERLDSETRAELLRVVRKSIDGKPMDNGEVSMLFFWVRHNDDPELSFVKEELNLGEDLMPKPKKKKRWFFRRKAKKNGNSVVS